MAHLTLGLLCYRFSEAASNLLKSALEIGPAINRWAESDEVVLDSIFLFCIAFFLTVVASVNLYLYGADWLRRGKSLIYTAGLSSGEQQKLSSAPGSADSVWINSFFNWLYFHGDKVPQLIPHALSRLTEESARISDEISIAFNEVQPGSLPPKILAVHTESESAEILVVHVNVLLKDVHISVHILRQAKDGRAVEGSWSLQDVQMEVRLHLSYNGGVVLRAVVVPGGASVGIIKCTDLKVQPNEIIGMEQLDVHLRRVLSSAVLTLHPECSPFMTSADSSQPGAEERNCSPTSALAEPPRCAWSSAAIDERRRAKKLFLTLCKARGLVATTAAVNRPSWSCTIEMDRPPQVHHAVAESSTLEWSKKFTFCLNADSKCLTFLLSDTSRPDLNQTPLQAVLALDDIASLATAAAPTNSRNGSYLVELPLGMSKSACTGQGSLIMEVSFADASFNAAISPSSSTDHEQVVSLVAVSLQGAQAGTATACENKLVQPEQQNDGKQGSKAYEPEVIEEHIVKQSVCTQDAAARVRNDTEVLVVSPDVIVDVAKQKLAEQSKLPMVPGSRTTTIIVTSLHKSVVADQLHMPKVSSEQALPQLDSCGSFTATTATSSSNSTLASSAEGTSCDRSLMSDNGLAPRDVMSEGLERVNGKRKDQNGNGRSYHPQNLEAKSEGHLKPEASAPSVNSGHNDTPASSASASDVRPKHKLSGLRKFLSFKKKQKPVVATSLSSPAKSKKH